jgi:hypothetical protein
VKNEERRARTDSMETACRKNKGNPGEMEDLLEDLNNRSAQQLKDTRLFRFGFSSDRLGIMRR